MSYWRGQAVIFAWSCHERCLSGRRIDLHGRKLFKIYCRILDPLSICGFRRGKPTLIAPCASLEFWSLHSWEKREVWKRGHVLNTRSLLYQHSEIKIISTCTSRTRGSEDISDGLRSRFSSIKLRLNLSLTPKYLVALLVLFTGQLGIKTKQTFKLDSHFVLDSLESVDFKYFYHHSHQEIYFTF